MWWGAYRTLRGGRVKLTNSDYSFMTIGEGKKAHIARVVKGSTKYAYTLCAISGKFGVVSFARGAMRRQLLVITCLAGRTTAHRLNLIRG